MQSESVFTDGAPQLKFRAGAVDEVGHDLAQLGARRVLVVTDPGLARTGHPDRVADSARRQGIEVVVFDRVHVEPTDASMREAIDYAREAGPFDAYVAVGGGSSIDTAKAVDLLSTSPPVLPGMLTALMRDIDLPPGVGAVGYRDDDVDDLVGGTMQQRLLATAPREVTEPDVAAIFRASMELW